MFYVSELMAKHGVQAVFSDSEGGVSSGCFESLNLGFDLGDDDHRVQANLERLCESSAFPLPHQAKQVHGSDVLDCEGEGLLHPHDADILMASMHKVPVAVRTADCLPILIADPKAGVVAAVHAGWRGTVAQVAEQAVAHMCKLGASSQSMVASLGPCIQQCCFEVGESVVEALHESCGEDVSQQRADATYADMSRANVLQLQRAGLLAGHIEVSESCTMCQISPHYFSYRRDAGKTGRQLAMVMLP